MLCRQAEDVILGLFAGVAHQHVPAPFGRGGRRSLVRLEQGRLVIALSRPGLLGFENEATALVEVDAQGGGEPLGLAPLHAALEDVIVGPSVVAGRVRTRQLKSFAEFRQEHLIVRALCPAARMTPALDKGFDIQRSPSPQPATAR